MTHTGHAAIQLVQVHRTVGSNDDSSFDLHDVSREGSVVAAVKDDGAHGRFHSVLLPVVRSGLRGPLPGLWTTVVDRWGSVAAAYWHSQ